MNDNEAIYKICGKSLKIIKNRESKRCPFDQTKYLEEFDGEICGICRVSKIGIDCMGLKIIP